MQDCFNGLNYATPGSVEIYYVVNPQKIESWKKSQIFLVLPKALIQEARIGLGYALSNSNASFLLFKFPACFISWWTHA